MTISKDYLIELASTKADAVGLYPVLVCAVIEQESDWRPWAQRYEPGFMSKYVSRIFQEGKISPTEAYARSFSWGLMQVMGQTAREHGFDGQFLSELCDPEVGLTIGCKVLAYKLDRAEDDVKKALLLYNGGGNPDYPAQVLSRAEKYTKETT